MEESSLESQRQDINICSGVTVPSNSRAIGHKITFGLFGYFWITFTCTFWKVSSLNSSDESHLFNSETLRNMAFSPPAHPLSPQTCKRGAPSSPPAAWALCAAVDRSSFSVGRVSMASSSADSSGWLLLLKHGTIRSL